MLPSPTAGQHSKNPCSFCNVTLREERKAPRGAYAISRKMSRSSGCIGLFACSANVTTCCPNWIFLTRRSQLRRNHHVHIVGCRDPGSEHCKLKVSSDELRYWHVDHGSLNCMPLRELDMKRVLTNRSISRLPRMSQWHTTCPIILHLLARVNQRTTPVPIKARNFFHRDLVVIRCDKWPIE